MKTLYTIQAIFMFLSLPGYAQQSGAGGGQNCRNEIDKHRIQIQEWIVRNDAKSLNFSIARIKGIVYENAPMGGLNYKSRMLEVLEEGKVIVNCYSRMEDLNQIAKKYSTHSEKVNIGSGCINYEDEDKRSHIDCDENSILDEKKRIQQGLPDDNFELTHHEFASIAGLEERMGLSTSDFTISDQLSQFKHREMREVLGPKKSLENDSRLMCYVPDLNLKFTKWIDDRDPDLERLLKINDSRIDPKKVEYNASISQLKNYNYDYGFNGDISRTDKQDATQSTAFNFNVSLQLDRLSFSFSEECKGDWIDGIFSSFPITQIGNDPNAHFIGDERKHKLYCVYSGDLYFMPQQQMNWPDMKTHFPNRCALNERPNDTNPNHDPFENFTESLYWKDKRLFMKIENRSTGKAIKEYHRNKKLQSLTPTE